MKALIIFLLAGSPFIKSTNELNEKNSLNITNSGSGFQQEQLHAGRMPAIEFKSQKYCRAEADDFEFDVKFKIVSATAYFSGVNFRDVQFKKINSNDLTPLKDLMSRCGPGTMVVFDDIKVLGPDNFVRPIQGVSYLLY